MVGHSAPEAAVAAAAANGTDAFARNEVENESCAPRAIFVSPRNACIRLITKRLADSMNVMTKSRICVVPLDLLFRSVCTWICKAPFGSAWTSVSLNLFDTRV